MCLPVLYASCVSPDHIATNRHKLHFPELATLADPGLVKVAIFIGTDISASTGIQIENGPQILTPWGYLAWQIGGAETYALVETEDRQRIAPGSDLLRKIFGDKSILLLMDEFLVYVSDAMGLVVGDTTFGRQVLTFVQKLTEVVRDLPKTVLVYSLQASVQEAVGDEGLLNILDKFWTLDKKDLFAYDTREHKMINLIYSFSPLLSNLLTLLDWSLD